MKKQLLLLVDLLGFSRKVMAQELNQIINDYRNLIIEIEHTLTWNKRRVKFDLISDSIIVFIEGEDLKTEFELLVDYAALIFHNLLIGSEILCRGAIVYDEFVVSKKDFNYQTYENGVNFIKTIPVHVILGKAIVKALNWEKAQEWGGISIFPQDLDDLKEIIPEVILNLCKNNRLLELDIPVKKSYNPKGKQRSLIVNPIFSKHAHVFNDILFKKYKLYKNNKEYRIKIQNTRRILKHMVKNNITIFDKKYLR